MAEDIIFLNDTQLVALYDSVHRDFWRVNFTLTHTLLFVSYFYYARRKVATT